MRKPATLLLLMTAAACSSGPVPMASLEADSQGRTFAAPPEGQAALYVTRTTDLGRLIRVAVGRHDLGPLGTNTWLRIDVAPGVQDVRCVGGEASKAIDVSLAAGETKFIAVQSTMGYWDARCDLQEVPATVGRQNVLAGRRVKELR